uniref:Uncharacterized protein n=1 Tax=Hyaloperonospora arabidopsidis (strain Emoy2) TaxID=559515 RepID=M4BZF4_HYAAE
MVWKFSSSSRRPCDTSAWYGVYDVYHPGFSSKWRTMGAGVNVSLKPMPMNDLSVWFFAAIAFNLASAWLSLRGAGRASDDERRISSGTVAATRASIVSYPIVASIACRSLSEETPK